MKNIIFSDIYGTLITSDVSLQKETIENIFFGQKRGVEFVLVTSVSIEKEIIDLAKQINVNYIIGNNGGQIFDIEKNEVLYDSGQIANEKGQGVEKFLEIFNVDFRNCMAIGDSVKDISMFEKVKHSYAMDNAADVLVKEKATHYTCDVKQNGFGMAIIDFMHREKLDR